MGRVVDVVTLSDSDEDEPPVDNEQSGSDAEAGQSQETIPCHVAIQLPDWFPLFQHYYQTRVSEVLSHDSKTDVDDVFKSVAKEWCTMPVEQRQNVTKQRAAVRDSAIATTSKAKPAPPNNPKLPSPTSESKDDAKCSPSFQTSDQPHEAADAVGKNGRPEIGEQEPEPTGPESHSALLVQDKTRSRQECEKENLVVPTADSKVKDSVAVSTKSAAKKKASAGDAGPENNHKGARTETLAVKSDRSESDGQKGATTSSSKKKESKSKSKIRSEGNKTKETADAIKTNGQKVGPKRKSEATIALERELERLMNRSGVEQRHATCLGPGCEKAPIDDPDWDCEYCSALCCSNHVSLEFQKFVRKEKKKNAAAAAAAASKNT